MYFDVVFLSDQRLDERLAGIRKAFEAEYVRRYGKTATKGLYRDEDWRRLAFCYSKISELGGSILDVGVGPGAFLNLLADDPRFNRVTGIDIRDYSKLVRLSDALDIQIMDVGKMSFADGSFDTAVCMEVLEHIDQPHFMRALAELRRVAAKRLFLTVPLREPEPLLPYHKQRFDFADIRKHFPQADLYVLKPRHGVPWLAVVEHLDRATTEAAAA